MLQRNSTSRPAPLDALHADGNPDPEGKKNNLFTSLARVSFTNGRGSGPSDPDRAPTSTTSRMSAVSSTSYNAATAVDTNPPASPTANGASSSREAPPPSPSTSAPQASAPPAAARPAASQPWPSVKIQMLEEELKRASAEKEGLRIQIGLLKKTVLERDVLSSQAAQTAAELQRVRIQLEAFREDSLRLESVETARDQALEDLETARQVIRTLEADLTELRAATSRTAESNEVQAVLQRPDLWAEAARLVATAAPDTWPPGLADVASAASTALIAAGTEDLLTPLLPSAELPPHLPPPPHSIKVGRGAPWEAAREWLVGTASVFEAHEIERTMLKHEFHATREREDARIAECAALSTELGLAKERAAGLAKELESVRAKAKALLAEKEDEVEQLKQQLRYVDPSAIPGGASVTEPSEGRPVSPPALGSTGGAGGAKAQTPQAPRLAPRNFPVRRTTSAFVRVTVDTAALDTPLANGYLSGFRPLGTPIGDDTSEARLGPMLASIPSGGLPEGDPEPASFSELGLDSDPLPQPPRITQVGGALHRVDSVDTPTGDAAGALLAELDLAEAAAADAGPSLRPAETAGAGAPHPPHAHPHLLSVPSGRMSPANLTPAASILSRATSARVPLTDPTIVDAFALTTPGGKDQQAAALAVVNKVLKAKLKEQERAIEKLEAELKDAERTHELRDVAVSILKEEFKELERRQKREGIDVDYIKNLLVTGFESGQLPSDSPLVPVLISILSLSPEEAARVKKGGKPGAAHPPTFPALVVPPPAVAANGAEPSPGGSSQGNGPATPKTLARSAHMHTAAKLNASLRPHLPVTGGGT